MAFTVLFWGEKLCWVAEDRTRRIIPLFTVKGDAGMEVQVNFCISKDRKVGVSGEESSPAATAGRGEGLTKTQGAIAKET